MIFSKKFFKYTTAIFCIFSSFNCDAKLLKIVSSTTPIASLVNLLIKNSKEIEITSLASGNSCPHHQHAKISDLDIIKNADLVIYINQYFDQFAYRLISKHILNKGYRTPKILNISSVSSLKLIYQNNDIVKYDKNNNVIDENKINWHLWLDLDNTIVILKEVAEYIIKLQPSLKEEININLEQAISDIQILSKQQKSLLEKKKNSQIILFSDSLSYFFLNYPSNKIIYFYLENNKGLNNYLTLKKELSKNSNQCLIFNKHQKTDNYQNPNIIKFDSENWKNPNGKKNINIYLEKYNEMIKLLSECS